MLRIWYHGTRGPAAKAIVRNGFAPGTYFAANLQDALTFGGKHVFEVAIDFDGPHDDWQIKCSNVIQPSAIVSYRHYIWETIKSLERPELRKAVFDANRVTN